MLKYINTYIIAVLVGIYGLVLWLSIPNYMDLEKKSIPGNILNKPGKLTADEFKIIKLIQLRLSSLLLKYLIKKKVNISNQN